VVVAVIAMRVVQMAVYQVVRMVAMRHHRMPAVRAVHVTLFVVTTLVSHAAVWVHHGHCHRALDHLVAFWPVQVTVVQVVDVIAVLYGCVPAAGTMLVSVVIV
jgi:hypothetical protein